ncbi:MAG TPA: hypothetical protein VEY50_05600 [Lysobacter sp.]|nr:hypothetical protein [Lysobacter sp.]
MRWPGWTEHRTLLLPLPEPPPTSPLHLAGLVLAPKRELHVTLIGRALGARLHASLREPYLGAAVRAAFDVLDWQIGFTGELRLLRKPARRDDGTFGAVHSVIELVRLPAMVGFHRALGRLLGSELAVPPPHVTRYTEGRAEGIGVPRPSALRAFSVRRLDAAPD